MANAEQAQRQLPELAALRQCLATLELPPAVRQTLDQAFTQSEGQLWQRLEQMAWQAKRCTLLGDIAARMGHEIRNPLHAILLHLEVVLGELQCPTLDSRTQMTESLTDIRMEARRLYDIMQDYLALARLAVIRYAPEDLGDFLRECGREVQEQARIRGMTLHLQGLARLGYVSLHKGTLQRAFLNLIQRALDTMPQGGTLTLRGRRTATHSSVEVRDTGSGIPEEQLDHLFEPFYTTGLEWTALGLYVVREIVAAHHGSIDVQSAPGQGTTFIVTFPLVALDKKRENY